MFLGAFFRCVCKEVSNRDIKSLYCPSCKKETYYNPEYKFCAFCSSSLKPVHVKRKKSLVDPEEVRMLFRNEDVLSLLGSSIYSNKGFYNHVYIGNMVDTGYKPIKFSADINIENFKVITESLIKESVDNFLSSYKDEYEILKQKYSPENVFVEFGCFDIEY